MGEKIPLLSFYFLIIKSIKHPLFSFISFLYSLFPSFLSLPNLKEKQKKVVILILYIFEIEFVVQKESNCIINESINPEIINLKKRKLQGEVGDIIVMLREYNGKEVFSLVMQEERLCFEKLIDIFEDYYDPKDINQMMYNLIKRVEKYKQWKNKFLNPPHKKKIYGFNSVNSVMLLIFSLCEY